jgi:ppGpp synthetase/RelA/SpoT-type nucleotidyltranferase
MGLNVSSIEERTKTVESFCEKITRDGKSYTNPLEEMTDLSGCRIITFYNDDLDTIEEMIRAIFSVDEANSVRKDLMDNPKEFGYLSRHFVVSFDSDRLKLGEFRRFKGMKAEIQVRSVLQHAWAAIEHKLQYKRSADIPRPLRRKLFQISALLEMADDQFSYIRKEVASLRQEYREELVSGISLVPLDIESLDVFLEDSEEFRHIKDLLPDAKFVVSPRPPNSTNTLSKLNSAISTSRINDLSELKEKMKDFDADEWVDFLDRAFDKWRDNVPLRVTSLGTAGPKRLVLDDTAIARLFLLHVSAHPIRKKLLRDVPFGDKLQTALISFIGDGTS